MGTAAGDYGGAAHFAEVFGISHDGRLVAGHGDTADEDVEIAGGAAAALQVGADSGEVSGVTIVEF